MSSVIALLTDFGLDDGFVGTVKGVIKSINRDVDIIDISHGVSPFDILEGAIILKASYRYFPEGTVFVCVVDPGVGTDRKAILVQTEKYSFIAPDNGLVSLAVEKEEITGIFELTNEKYFLKRDNETFHGRDIFAPVAAYITRGVRPEELGKKIDKIKEIDIPAPYTNDGYMIGQIIKFDRFGNGITNIEDIPPFEYITVKNYRIERICRNFLEGVKNSLNIIKGSFGYYEVFVPEGSAKDIFGLKVGDKVKIKLKR